MNNKNSHKISRSEQIIIPSRTFESKNIVFDKNCSEGYELRYRLFLYKQGITQIFLTVLNKIVLYLL